MAFSRPARLWLISGLLFLSVSSVRQEAAQSSAVVQGVVVKKTELPEFAVIRGRVVIEGGGPAQKLRVRALKARYTEGRRELSPIKETSTDDRGEFRLFDLVPGRYYIGVFPPQVTGNTAQLNSQMANSGTDVLAPVYFPGKTQEQDRAQPIELRPGETYDAGTLTSLHVPPIRVSGEIIDGVTGRLATSCEARVTEGSLPSVRSLPKENCRGKFDFYGLAPGRYGIFASVPGPPGALSSRGELEVEVRTKDLANLKVVLQRDYSIQGRISFEGRARSVNDPELAKLWIQLPGNSQFSVYPDGAFSSARVSPGPLFPRITGLSPDAYIKTMRLGNRDLTDSGLVVSGPVNGVLEIVIGTQGAGVTVSVQDGLQKLFAGATVALVPDSARRKNWRLYKSAVSNGEGKVQLQGIAPGDYTLFAWEDVEENAWQSPDFLQAYEGRGIRVHLADGMRQEVNVPLIR